MCCMRVPHPKSTGGSHPVDAAAELKVQDTPSEEDEVNILTVCAAHEKPNRSPLPTAA